MAVVIPWPANVLVRLGNDIAAVAPLDGVADVTFSESPFPPEWHIVTRTSDGEKIRVDYRSAATPAQIRAGDYVGQQFLPESYKLRPLSDIYQDLQALTAAQHTNAWNDISAPVPGVAPRKYLTDTGPNAAALFVMDYTVYVTAPTGVKLTAAQKNILAQYCQDNVTYLVNPPFDPSINVPGAVPT